MRITIHGAGAIGDIIGLARAGHDVLLVLAAALTCRPRRTMTALAGALLPRSRDPIAKEDFR
jgi:hypothetical protein